MLYNKCHGGSESWASGLFRAGSLEEVVLQLTLKGGWVYRLRRDSDEDGVFPSGPAELVLQKQGPQSSVLANLKIPTFSLFFPFPLGLLTFLLTLLPSFFPL